MILAGGSRSGSHLHAYRLCLAKLLINNDSAKEKGEESTIEDNFHWKMSFHHKVC